jgi:hypothetical protein
VDAIARGRRRCSTIGHDFSMRSAIALVAVLAAACGSRSGLGVDEPSGPETWLRRPRSHSCATIPSDCIAAPSCACVLAHQPCGVTMLPPDALCSTMGGVISITCPGI